MFHDVYNEESLIIYNSVTDHFALAVADEFLQLFEGGQPAVAIILPGDSAQEVGQPRLV